jgi:hypothetical protein
MGHEEDHYTCIDIATSLQPCGWQWKTVSLNSCGAGSLWTCSSLGQQTLPENSPWEEAGSGIVLITP